MKCRHCGANVTVPFLDLGSSPPSNAYLDSSMLQGPEKWFPLCVMVCTECWLVQTEDYARSEELFSVDYSYFSSYSTTWLAHSKRYVAEMVARFKLNSESMIVEVAANDGYMLQYAKERSIPCYGIEPTASTAAAARLKGIEIVEEFFGRALANNLVDQGRQADLMAANNVLAHVPDINDFVGGFSLLLKPQGVATFEFPHLVKLVEGNQFDTIYHEHYSYLSLSAVQHIFSANGLVIFDVEEIATHGGSLRVFAQRADVSFYSVSQNVANLLDCEIAAGIQTEEYYRQFQSCADHVRDEFLSFLVRCKGDGKKVAAYGAAAKGNTLLNYAGVQSDLLPYVVDKSPAKQGRFLPGSHIPILEESYLKEDQPDYVIILPWNLADEVLAQLEYIRQWGGKFVTFVPAVQIR